MLNIVFRRISALKQYQEFFWAFTWRNIRLQYNQFWLGLFWGIIQPLLMSSIFYVALNKGVGTDFNHYFLYIYSGFVFWNVFSGGLSQAQTSFIQNDSLVKNIYFPRLLLPLTFLASKVIDLLIAFLILIGLVVLTGITIHVGEFVLFTLLGLIQLFFVSVGFNWLFSVISVRFRGFQVIYPFVSQAIFFTSSVVYSIPISIENKWLMSAFSLNPITTTLETFRSAIFSDSIDVRHALFNTAYAVFIGLLGYIWFRIEDKNLIDRL